MKNLKIGMLFFLLSLGFVASSSATPYYVANGNIKFIIAGEFASSESAFGAYAIADPSNRFEIFSYKKEPLATKTVKVSQWSPLSEGFGFYFAVHTGGKNDPTADYYFFSDPSLNKYTNGTPVDIGLEHIAVGLFPKLTTIQLEDQLGGDWDRNDMIVTAFGDLTQVVPAPVPEPATMLLFGAGIVGLAGFARRKKI